MPHDGHGSNVPAGETLWLPFDPPRAARSPAIGPPMERLLAVAARVAPLDVTVLITGETGVGKERLARRLHEASSRARGPFVAINCGAFTDTLLESELFGHARGAFTGAFQDHSGVFEAADGGTLLLDEIGEVSTAMQVRLLRVLQEREVRRVGETRTRRINVRVIAATNRDLSSEVEKKSFRGDLYYRLRVIDLHVPPLRERPEELRDLAGDLLEGTAARLRRPIVGFTPAAFARLFEYPWPGNIRELEHAVERACALAAGPLIEVDDLPEPVRTHGGRARGDQSLATREAAHIRSVLARHRGHRSSAAAELGISLSSLKRRLRRAGLPR